MLGIRLIGRRRRKQRIEALVAQLGTLEAGIRDCCSALLELTEPGDDLAVEVERLLAALDR